MKLTGLLATGAICHVVAGTAAPEAANAPQYVSLSVDKSRGSNFADSKLGARPYARITKRDDDQYAEIKLENQKTFYSVNLTIGTPPQEVLVLVDTGSSDLWIQSSDVYCGPNESKFPLDCNEYGTFDTSASSSWSKNESSYFYIGYADSTYAEGYWGMDILTIAGHSADGLTFAVANASNSSMGVLGIGLPELEATNTRSHGFKTYDNLPMILKRNGVIAKNAYSLFTNELDAEHGSILFGAVDHSKYTGELLTLPITPTFPYRDPSLGPLDLAITLSGISYNGRRGNNSITTTLLPALLDSGTTFTYLPEVLADELVRRIGGVWNQRLELYLARCSDADRGDSFTFDFGGATIVTPIKDYFVETNTNGICIVSLNPTQDGSVILGDNFLSSAYVVYDLDDKEVSIAQADFSGRDEEIEVIKTSVPRASRAPGYDNVWRSPRPVSLNAQSTADGSGSPSSNAGTTVSPMMSMLVTFAGLLSVFM